MTRKVHKALFVFALLLGCAPHTRLACRFQLPTHAGEGHDPSHLHVRARASCGGTGEVTAPAPGLEDTDVAEPKAGTESAVPVQRDEWETSVMLHSASCTVAMTAWFDLNENGKVDDGEYVGVLPSREIRDRGLCAGDVTVAPPVTLAAHHP